MPAKTASSFNPKLPPAEDWGRNRHPPEYPTVSNSDAGIAAGDFTTGLFPPPSALHSSRNRPKKLLLRLKSDPCLRDHSSGAFSSSYTDYDFTTAPISPISIESRPILWRSNTPNSIGSDSSMRKGNMFAREDETSNKIPSLNILGKDVFKALLQDPAVVSRLCVFAEPHGSARDIEFLQKVHEYAQATRMLASTLSAISASFVGIAASTPIDLPTETWKDLNTDLKQISGSIVPCLDGVFRSAGRYVEQCLLEDLYPKFLTAQASHALLDQRTARTLTIGSLGQSFCLTNPYSADNDIVCVSDGFLDLSGYSQSEVLSQNCRFLQGSNTRYAAITRIRGGLLKGEASSELVLNYRKDGHGFWNLLFIAPLVDSDGVLQYHLGGQIDISEMFKTRDDLVKLLTSSKVSRDSASASRDGSIQTSCVVQSESDGKRRSTRRSASPERLRKKSSRTKFLQTFRKQPANEALLSPVSMTTNMSRSEPDLLVTGVSGGSWSTTKTSGMLPAQDSVPSPYSQYMVLQFLSGKPRTYTARKDASCRFPVAFCSSETLKQFGLGHHELLHRDVFELLQDVASPCSGAKSIRAIVRDQLIDGKSANFDVTIRHLTSDSGPSGRHRKPGMTSLSNWNIFTTEASHSQETASCRDDGESTRLTSYWTPLKDGNGTTKWVVVVLLPAAPET